VQPYEEDEEDDEDDEGFFLFVHFSEAPVE
jgi:hypothetical protein